NPSINVLIGVPINFPVKNPTTIVTNGVTIISTFVNLYTNFPTSVAHKTATYLAAGPPNSAPNAPEKSAENKTRGGAFNPYAIETPIAPPITLGSIANSPISTKDAMPNWSPMVLIIDPIINDENKPNAI